jgi:non-specific serine/threonine protein kinase
MLVLHANWSDGALRLWAESLARLNSVAAVAAPPGAPPEPALRDSASGTALATAPAETASVSVTDHPLVIDADALRAALIAAGLMKAEELAEARDLTLLLPRDEQGVLPSDRLAAAAGVVSEHPAAWLGEFSAPTVAIRSSNAASALLALEDRGDTREILLGHTMRYWVAVARFVIELLADQRFIPTLIRRSGGELTAKWQPWLRDEPARGRAAALLGAMPPLARAVVDDMLGRPGVMLDEAMRTLTDSVVREALRREAYHESIDGWIAAADPHVAWLQGLLHEQAVVPSHSHFELDLLKEIRRWVMRLEDVGAGRPARLGFALIEPPLPTVLNGSDEAEPSPAIWTLGLRLVASDGSGASLDAARIWTDPAAGHLLGDHVVDDPQGLLLSELHRAAGLYPKIETALTGAAPSGFELTTSEAYAFLREYKPLLEESGFEVSAPRWWGDPASRLGARLQVDADALQPQGVFGDGPSTAAPPAPARGLHSLVRYRWQIAVGDQPLSLEQFQRMARQQVPLVRIGGRWVELLPDEVERAFTFLRERRGGETTVLEAIRMAHGLDGEAALPVVGMDATGWVADLFSATAGSSSPMMELDQPRGFVGALRPYQKRGMSWLAFLDRLGLGACLADDMGLGKTIQLIALMLHEREAATAGERIGPTLLVVPTSVVSNWTRELQRFAPSLAWHVHHGLDRPIGRRFLELAEQRDVVITTYALISRDAELLGAVPWRRVALDEAQYIKNPPTKQATAIRALPSRRRVALTGTPVENRLTELWSIMDFCNPGYLGQAAEFRRRIAVPVERHRDRVQAERLRSLVRPFILRRLKTDSTVIADLPECVQTREYATLTPEQAALYQRLVDSMLAQVEQSEGIRRRGLVLATLVKLKQVCNHPSLLLKDHGAAPSEDDVPGEGVNGNGDERAPRPLDAASSLAARSGKCQRLLEMLDEIVASGSKALVFTQFRQMGHLLGAMIQQALDVETLFMHGGTPQQRRQDIIDRFQDPAGRAPVFILSLKAGGLGLNLTAASHVFHFDRWWNPAVENQATDRAYRIGQTRTVQVHKFVCLGTLEERIDEMLEQKTELAENIIGSGESWLTELSTGQLRDLLTLRYASREPSP